MNAPPKQIRMPATAGAFYPSDPTALRREISAYLRGADVTGPYPKALIAPHAGYKYSGPVAASGYSLLQPIRDIVERVVLLGPSHRFPFYGLAASEAEEFETPLGSVPVDMHAVAATLKLPQVHLLDEAHEHEHSLEVHLPFLQIVLREFALVPLSIGDASADEVAGVLELLWNEMETLIVVSSDLSHYYDYATARRIDSETAHLIERCQWQQISSQRACGYAGICGLLKVAQAHNLQVTTVDLRNSGDTAGPKNRVVGYGSFVVY